VASAYKAYLGDGLGPLEWIRELGMPPTLVGSTAADPAPHHASRYVSLISGHLNWIESDGQNEDMGSRAGLLGCRDLVRLAAADAAAA